MRNIPIPIDTAKLTFVCVAAPRPRLVSQETGEVKVDASGRTVYQVGLSVEDQATGKVELITVSVSGEPNIGHGQIATPVDMVGFLWEMTRDGVTRWGIAYRAASIVPVTATATATAEESSATVAA